MLRGDPGDPSLASPVSLLWDKPGRGGAGGVGGGQVTKMPSHPPGLFLSCSLSEPSTWSLVKRGGWLALPYPSKPQERSPTLCALQVWIWWLLLGHFAQMLIHSLCCTDPGLQLGGSKLLTDPKLVGRPSIIDRGQHWTPGAPDEFTGLDKCVVTSSRPRLWTCFSLACNSHLPTPPAPAKSSQPQRFPQHTFQLMPLTRESTQITDTVRVFSPIVSRSHFPSWVFVCLFVCFGFFILALRLAGSQFPDQGLNSCPPTPPPQWKRGVLTTGLPGSPPNWVFDAGPSVLS